MKEEGYRISIGMVRELMRDMGLISIRQDAKDLYDKEQKKYKNHLNQEFTATRPNEIWVSDVTYFRYKEQVFYICAILDLYSRMVVGFRISHKNSTQLTKGTNKLMKTANLKAIYFVTQIEGPIIVPKHFAHT